MCERNEQIFLYSISLIIKSKTSDKIHQRYGVKTFVDLWIFLDIFYLTIKDNVKKRKGKKDKKKGV